MKKEKRLATILYADLSGFTKLTSDLGAEQTTEFINACFGVIDSIINSYGGTVMRHEGDRVMAVYGFPKSRGKDSYYGLITALRIREAVKHFIYPVGVHVGLATGEIFIEGIEIYGHVIEEASYLEELAGDGEISINKNCYEINKSLFDFQEANNEGINFYRLLSEKKLLPEYKTEFLDREKEFSVFGDLVNQKEKLITIIGPGGIGKTRFVRESLRRINNDNKFNFYEVSFLGSSQGTPFGGIVKLINIIKPDFQFDSCLELSEERYRLRLFKSFTQIFIEDSGKKPIIIFLQSVDLIDPDSLEYLRYFINNIYEYWITVIIEMRTQSKDVVKAVSEMAKFPLKVLIFEPLSKEDAMQMVLNLTSSVKLPQSLIKKIIDFSQGNPLYLEESCHYILNEFKLGKNPQEIVLPYRLRELVSYVIDTIPANYLWDLSIFSAYGYEIDKRIAKTLVPDYKEFVDYCVNDDLIQIDVDKISFKPPIIRDELYARLSKELRQKFHNEIAKVLVDNLLGSESFGLIAYHYDRAGNYERTLSYTIKWAKYLQDTHMTAQAIEAYSVALELAEHLDKNKRFDILLEKVKILNRVGRRDEEKKAVERLLTLSEEANNKDWLVQALIVKGYYLEAIADYKRACEIYESLCRERESQILLERLGIIHYNQGNMQEAIELFNRGLEMARRDADIKGEAIFYRNLGMVYEKLGEKDRVQDNYQRAKLLFEKVGDTISLGYLTAEFGNLYFALSEYYDAQNLYNEALQIANKIGDEVFKSEMLRRLGNVSYILGDYEKELAFLQASLDINRKILNKRGEADVYHNMAITYSDLGHFEEALNYFNIALKIDEEINHQEGIALHLGDIASCYRRTDQLDEAAKYLKKSLKIIEDLHLRDHLAYYYNELALVQLEQRKVDDAKKSAEKSIDFARKAKHRAYEIVALSTYGLVNLRSGDIRNAFKVSQNAITKLDITKEIEGSKARLYFIHYLILNQHNKKKEALEFLDKAYFDIKSRGKKINDKQHRDSFYQIKENKEVIEEWEQVKKLK